MTTQNANPTPPTPVVALDSDRWFTPQAFVDNVARELALTFTLDPSAEKGANKAPVWFGIDDDGLAQDWNQAAGDGAVWLNCPYSDVDPWLEKARQTVAAGTPVVALLRASTDTIAFHERVPGAAQVWALRGRMRYERPDGSTPGPANHASLVVVWLPDHDGPTVLDYFVTAELCTPRCLDCGAELDERGDQSCQMCLERCRVGDNQLEQNTESDGWRETCLERMDDWCREQCGQATGNEPDSLLRHCIPCAASCDDCSARAAQGEPPCHLHTYDPRNPDPNDFDFVDFVVPGGGVISLLTRTDYVGDDIFAEVLGRSLPLLRADGGHFNADRLNHAEVWTSPHEVWVLTRPSCWVSGEDGPVPTADINEFELVGTVTPASRTLTVTPAAAVGIGPLNDEVQVPLVGTGDVGLWVRYDDDWDLCEVRVAPAWVGNEANTPTTFATRPA